MVAEMRRSLKELDLGLKGELTITSDMEALSDSLFFDEVRLFQCINQHPRCSKKRFLPLGPSLHMPPSTASPLGMLTFSCGSR